MLLEISHPCVCSLFVLWYCNVVATGRGWSHCSTGRRSKALLKAMSQNKTSLKKERYYGESFFDGITLSFKTFSFPSFPRNAARNHYPLQSIFRSTDKTRLDLGGFPKQSEVYGMSVLSFFSLSTHSVCEYRVQSRVFSSDPPYYSHRGFLSLVPGIYWRPYGRLWIPITCSECCSQGYCNYAWTNHRGSKYLSWCATQN